MHHVRPAASAARGERQQAVAVDRLDERGLGAAAVAREVEEGRQQIDEGDVLRPPRGTDAGPGDDERHAHRTLEEAHLVPEPALAEQVAVVGGREHHGVVEPSDRVERLHHFAEEAVHVARHRVIGVAGGADMLFGDPVVAAVVGLPEPPAVRVAPLRRLVGHPRHVDLVVVVERVLLLRREIGIVRMHEGDGQHERPVVLRAARVVEPAHRLARHLLVVVDLERAAIGSRLAHAQHVVEPPVNLLRLLPGRGPAEVAGIHVGRDPLLVAVELVGADEMHLAGKAGSVAGGAQIVREGRHARGELGRVVPGADAAHALARHHREARGRAERRVAVGVLEERAAPGERVDVRRLDQRMAVAGQRLRRELVEHDEEDVRSALGHGGTLDAVAPAALRPARDRAARRAGRRSRSRARRRR